MSCAPSHRTNYNADRTILTVTLSFSDVVRKFMRNTLKMSMKNSYEKLAKKYMKVGDEGKRLDSKNVELDQAMVINHDLRAD